MLLTNTLTAFITITGTKNMYLEAQNTKLTDDLIVYTALCMNDEIAPTFVEVWKNDPEMIRRPYTADEQAVRDYMKVNPTAADQYTLEQYRDAGESREALLKAFYDNMAEQFDLMFYSGRFDRLYCIVPDDDGSATVVLECTADTVGADHGIGTRLSEDRFEYSCLKKVPKTQNGLVDFDFFSEEFFDETEKTSLYAAYSPIYVDGKLSYVVFIEFDWTTFAYVLRSNLVLMIIYGLVGMVIANAVLILYIYFRAVRPITKVNAGVREYMETKDSSEDEAKVWFGILEISSGKITAVNAGHEYPAIRQPDGSFELFKDKHGFMVGIRKNKKYTEYEIELKKGATLFVYTDGVPEATDRDEQLLGTDRMVDALNKEPEAAPERLLENVHNAVNEFVGEAPQFDDLTRLALKIN